MAELVMFPGVRRERLEQGDEVQAEPTLERTSQAVLQAAIDAGLGDVVLVGLLPDGTLYVASESDDNDAVAGKLLRAANYIASIDLEDEYEIEE